MTPTILHAALGRYPATAALRDGRLRSPLLELAFTEFPAINRAFAPMVRELRFDVSEMAIATALQARAEGKALVVLPVTVAARFQEAALLCRRDGDVRGPADLAGRRVGVRAYSQTTGMWLRGILADGHGVRPDAVRWITFEDAHVLEYRDPPWAERAAAGSDMLAMLRDGALDAAIVGNELPDDPTLRPVFKDPAEAGEAFWRAHGFAPVNHMVVVRRELAETRPDLVRELLRLFGAAKDEAAARNGRDMLPMGREALRPAMVIALRYADEQGLLSRPLTLDEVWDGLPSDE